MPDNPSQSTSDDPSDTIIDGITISTMPISTKRPRLVDDQSAEGDAKPQVIRVIDDQTIKFIAAGEKISDIETAIRELLENSIDAQAKCIEIRLARFGIDAIEVEDNGFGIDESNFHSIGIRYHTSKISDYKNLQENLETFGFRGEALSCLCNIANVTITTKCKKSPTGWRLSFNKDGTISKKEPMGRDNGTTVIIKNLFHSMPVRKRELETTAKKQYDKIIRLIYEEVLARPHIKFSLCKKNAAKKEKEFTHGGNTLEGCIITIFGINVLETLMSIRQAGQQFKREITTKTEKQTTCVETEHQYAVTCKPDSGTLDQGEDEESVENPASSISSSTRALTDDELDVSTAANTSTNGGQEFFKRSRKSKYARERPDYRIHGYISKIGSGRNSTDCQYIFVNRKPCDIPKLSRVINETFRSYSRDQSPFFCLFIVVQSWAADFNVPRKRAVILQEETKLFDLVRESLEEMFSPYAPGSQKSCPIAQIPMLTQPKAKLVQLNSTARIVSAPKKSSKRDDEARPEPYPMPHQQTTSEDQPTPNLERHSRPNDESRLEPNSGTELRPDSEAQLEQRPRAHPNPSVVIPPCSQLHPKPNSETHSGPNHETVPPRVSTTPRVSPPKPKRPKLAEEPIVSRLQQNEMLQNGDLKARIDYLEDLPTALERERVQRKQTDDMKEFSFAIHPKFNSVAEEQLKFNLNKISFLNMQPLGQFNKGFIIARLNKHLFIIDQHATDERANYEDQLEKCPLESQVMIHPKPLFLNLIQENAILNNIEAFTRRGLNFLVNKEAMIGYRVMLSATSVCKGLGRDEHLGKEDIEELIDVILESPNRLESYTLKKVREVAASRACRKSVMIGETLTWQQMTRIVRRMCDLNNPWVCAHNRPTIRHLMDIDWMYT